MAVGILAGSMLAGLVGYGLGFLTLNMRKIYLALATWAFAESYRLFIASEYQYTRGDMGLHTSVSAYGVPVMPVYYLCEC
jgi:branched-chain amino acid transport system permease protein